MRPFNRRLIGRFGRARGSPMKRRLFLLVILVSVTCACSGSAGSPAPPSGSSSATPFIYPSDEELQNILPAEVGTSWVYAIEVGSVDPVRYQDRKSTRLNSSHANISY